MNDVPSEPYAVLEEWVAKLVSHYELDPAHVPLDVLLDLTRDIAHGIARPAAPVTSFIVGLVAGRAGGSVDDVARVLADMGTLVDEETH